MAWQPPTEWEQYINGFDSSLAPPVDLSVPPVEQFALPGELAKHGDVNAPPPPPPPPQTIAAPGVPVQDEVPQGAVAPPLTPEEEAQIQIDAPPPAPELQTPPMLQPDAISGGYTPEQIAQAQGTLDVHGEDTRPLLGEPMGGEDLGKFLSTLPVEQQEEFRRKTEEGRQKVADAGKLEADTQKLRDAEDSARIYQDSVREANERAKQLDVEARQLADENPLDSISGGRKIMGVLASIVGGFMANKTGRNMGLEAVDQIANDAMQLHAQKLQLNARQQAGIGDQIQRAGDVQKAALARGLAVYDGAIRHLETQVQQFDPRGTTALRVLDDINALKQKRADAMQKYLQGEQKRIEDQKKYELDAMKAHGQYAKDMADAQKTGLESARLAGQLGGGGAAKQSPDFWEKYSAAPGVQGKRPPMAMTPKEYQAWLGTLGKAKALDKGPNDKSDAQIRKEEAEATKAEAEAAAASTGYAIKNPETGHIIMNPDGSPVLEMDATKRNRASGIIEAATNIRRLADRMAELKAKDGGAWKVLGSDEAQELQNLASMIDFETFKAFDLGAPSEGDKALAEGVRGGVDPTSFVKNATAGFQAYADAVEKKANAALRGSGYEGPALHFHRASDLKKAKPDVVDEIGGRLAASVLKETAKATADNPLAEVDQKLTGAFYGQINKETNEDLDKLAAYAEVPNDMGDRARKYLGELAKKAIYPQVKERAKAILDGLPGAHPRTER